MMYKPKFKQMKRIILLIALLISISGVLEAQRQKSGAVSATSKIPQRGYYVDYRANLGSGTIYLDGRALKVHTGWATNWHTILRIGSVSSNRFLFYNKDAGIGEFYSFDTNGNIHQIKRHEGWSRNWTKIESIGSNSLKFYTANGYYEVYSVDGNGNINLTDKYSKLGLQPFMKYFRIKNKQKGGHINIEGGNVTAFNAPVGWASAKWIFEKSEMVNGVQYVRIKNQWKGTYLNVESGKIQCTAIQPTAWSSQWEIVDVPGTNYVKIRNRWKSDWYLHHNWDAFECATIQQTWDAAQWVLEFDVN